MKALLYFCFLLSIIKVSGQANPTNPFPNNKKATTPATTTVPPVNQQQIPPQPTKSSVPPPTSQAPTPVLPPITGTDQEQIYQTVVRVFDAMRAADTLMARPLFSPNCRLYTPMTNAAGQMMLNEESLNSFFKAISTKRAQVVDERILKYKIDIDGALAQMWADYNLYVGDKFIHCGVDVFQLYKSPTGWKIFELADTRRTTGCLADPKDEVAKILDQWHADAAATKADAYFGAMTSDGVFLGTDATERWTRDEFRTWAKPQFDARKGWNFKASKRHVSMANEDTIAWFDEELTTWMGPCRGSGVLVKTSDGWKIKQYNLTILVPNEKVQDYLKVIGLK